MVSTYLDGSLTGFVNGQTAYRWNGSENASTSWRSGQTKKTDEIDNIAEAIIRENMGALATDATRDLSTYLSVQVDLSAWPSTTKEFSHRNVAEVMGANPRQTPDYTITDRNGC